MKEGEVIKLSSDQVIRGLDGALRRPRIVQRRNNRYESHVFRRLLSPLIAGWDGAARRPYHNGAA